MLGWRMDLLFALNVNVFLRISNFSCRLSSKFLVERQSLPLHDGKEETGLRKVVILGLFMAAFIGSVASAQPQQVKTLKIRSIKVLTVIYRGAPAEKDRFDDQKVLAIKNGLAAARLFYFRNTQCRLNVEMASMVVDERAPNSDGPSYDNIVDDLKTRGVRDNQYDGIFCTGLGFGTNYGGFHIFGKTAGAFASFRIDPDFEWWPAVEPDTSYLAAWMFTHEFQHALDFVICDTNSNHPEMLMDHPYADSTEPYFHFGHHAAQHFDWVAHCLTSFTAYDDLKTPTNTVLTITDADGDGMPDNDPRLPMDEKRFGSDSTKKDTDKDGLDDLHEFCGDIFRGSNPRQADTDNDGVRDGKDKYPTVAMAQKLVYTASLPTVDGAVDKCYKGFVSGSYAGNASELEKSTMLACWNEKALNLFVKAKQKCTLEVWVDTSALNGYWEGGDTYIIQATPEGKVGIIWPEKRDLPDAKAIWGVDGLEVTIPAKIGQGVSQEINYSGKRRPEDTVEGMTLKAGQIVSFNMRLINGDERALFTPNHAMFDVMLVKP